MQHPSMQHPSIHPAAINLSFSPLRHPHELSITNSGAERFGPPDISEMLALKIQVHDDSNSFMVGWSVHVLSEMDMLDAIQE